MTESDMSETNPIWVERLSDTQRNTPLTIEGNLIRNYTIPLIYEEKYFLAELYHEKQVCTIFSLLHDSVIVDMFRNMPRSHSFGQTSVAADGALEFRKSGENSWLYRLESDEAGSRLGLVFARSTLFFKIIDGCLVTDGPMYFTNVAEAGTGVPVGVWAQRDYKIQFRKPLSSDFIRILTLKRQS